MKKSAWMICGVMIGCSGASPSPTAQPLASKTAPRTDLDTSRIEIWPPLDTRQVFQELTVQREVARAHRDRKTMCEALEANDSDECGKNSACTSRIEPDCEMCAGGALVCVAKESDTAWQALHQEQEMLQCLGMRATTWHIYKGEHPVTTGRVFQRCLCDEPAFASIESYIEQGAVQPHVEAGECISDRALCERSGGTFQKARLLGRVTPESYEAYGLNVQANARFRSCNLSVRRPSEAAKDDAFVGIWEDDRCVIYRFEGYEIARSAREKESMPELPARYLPHRCDTPRGHHEQAQPRTTAPARP